MKSNQGLDGLGDGALAVVLDLRRIGVTLASNVDTLVLYYGPQKSVTGELMGRLCEHARELIEFFDGRGGIDLDRAGVGCIAMEG